MAEQTFRQKVQAMADKERAKLEAKKKQYWEEWMLDGIISRERLYNKTQEKIDEIDLVLHPVSARELRDIKRDRNELEISIRQFKMRMASLEKDELQKENPDKALLETVMSIVNTYFP